MSSSVARSRMVASNNFAQGANGPSILESRLNGFLDKLSKGESIDLPKDPQQLKALKQLAEKMLKEIQDPAKKEALKNFLKNLDDWWRQLNGQAAKGGGGGGGAQGAGGGGGGGGGGAGGAKGAGGGGGGGGADGAGGADGGGGGGGADSAGGAGGANGANQTQGQGQGANTGGPSVAGIQCSDPTIRAALTQIARDPEGAKLLEAAKANGLTSIDANSALNPSGGAGTQGETIQDGSGGQKIQIANPNSPDLIQTLTHELVHAATPADGDSKLEEQTAQAVGARMEQRLIGRVSPLQLNMDSYDTLSNSNSIKQDLLKLGITV